MDDESLAVAAAVWVKGRTAKAALAELFIMVAKMGGNQEAILRHLGMWPDEGGAAKQPRPKPAGQKGKEGEDAGEQSDAFG